MNSISKNHGNDTRNSFDLIVRTFQEATFFFNAWWFLCWSIVLCAPLLVGYILSFIKAAFPLWFILEWRQQWDRHKPSTIWRNKSQQCADEGIRLRSLCLKAVTQPDVRQHQDWIELLPRQTNIQATKPGTFLTHNWKFLILIVH